jgi:rRNA processing protein Krr1/Pno1
MEVMKIENIRKISKNKKTLEKELKVKIFIKGRNIEFSGKEIDEFVAEKVLEALNLGFSVPVALMLKDEQIMFETLNIRSLSNKDPKIVRGRVIGTKRKTLDTIEQLSDCKIVLHENTVGIIANAEDMQYVLQALTSLIKGAKQSNIYKYLEKINTKFREPLKLVKE